jgi:hypothetical protein
VHAAVQVGDVAGGRQYLLQSAAKRAG